MSNEDTRAEQRETLESDLNRVLYDWNEVFYWDVSAHPDETFSFHLYAYTVFQTNSQEPSIASTYESMTWHDAWVAVERLDEMFGIDNVSLTTIREAIGAAG